MRLHAIRDRVWRCLYRYGHPYYLNGPSLGRALVRTNDRIRHAPLTTVAYAPSLAFQKELDRQPIGATLNLPQEAP